MATIRLIPSILYNYAGTNYLQISNETNAFTNTDSTSYATIYNRNASTSSRYFYIRGFNFDDVPEQAIVTSFTIRLKGYEEGISTSTSYQPYLANGTNTINGSCSPFSTSSTTRAFSGISASWETIKGYGDDFGIRINCRRASRNTAGYIYLQGAEIEVTYTLPVSYTITSSTTIGTISPSGSTSVFEGDSYTLTINANNPIVTDNGNNVTSQLQRITNGTDTFIPYDYDSSGFTISNIANAYSNISDNNSADCSLSGRTTGTLYLDLGPVNIPTGATISNISCQASLQIARNGSSSGMTASCQMYSGNTAKGSSTTLVTSATDVARTTYTMNMGSWTASELQNARFYVTMYNGASSTVRHLYIYGISLTITYQVNGEVYIYTINSVTGNHTIIVSSGGSTPQDQAWFKISGTWRQVSQIYKKINGTWVLQTDYDNVFTTGTNYKG